MLNKTRVDSLYNKVFKRMLDIFFSFIALIILSPLILIISIIIKISSKGPIFYKQDRVGLNNKLFRIFKFRSMVENAEKHGSGILKSSIDDNRITKFGKFLRKTSLDELPQLINILRGDMSFVGPRPTVEIIAAKFTKEESNRHLVRPGITGLAQVNGRQSLDWNKKIIYDLHYVNNVSLIIDIKIILKTFVVVLFQDNTHI